VTVAGTAVPATLTMVERKATITLGEEVRVGVGKIVEVHLE
jgi:hypothetical protein